MRKIKEHSEFISELYKVNPNISVLSSYNGLTIDKVKCKCTVCNYEWETYPYLLLNGSGCKICRKKPKGEFKYDIGYIITTHSRNLLILDREYREWFNKKTSSTSNRKYYKYKCLDCGNEDWINECRIVGSCTDGCNVCKSPPNRLVRGVNDIETLLPQIARLFKNHAEASQHTRGSRCKTTFVCPDCGRELIKRIDTVCACGLCCPCNDKWSYPNKFIYSVLEQLNLNFTPEKTFDWSKGRRYDECILKSDKLILIEMQGGQHSIRPIRSSGRCRSVEEEQANDKLKHNLAMDNGVNYYFTIDCIKSDVDYIKNSIISSGLLDVLGIDSNSIDWNKCDEFATSNFVKRVCNYYSETSLPTKEIAKHFKMSIKTIQRYLRTGDRLGWCTYDGKNIPYKNSKNGRNKPVYCKEVNMTFDNATAAARYLNLPDAKNNGRSIRNSIKFCRPYHNYTFNYV